MRKAVVLVMDGVGCGELPDAHLYGDSGTNTIAHVAKNASLSIPVLESFGFGNITPITGVKKVAEPLASYGKMVEVSPGKDSVTGHWEIAGMELSHPFPTYENGFPPEIISLFEERTGRGTLGNYPASGTAIIEELGEEHMSTGKLIVYTSADSVFQIAAHQDVVPYKTLYEYCEIAREILRGVHEVGRVIARPFIGSKSEGFTRTKYRKDYSVTPFDPTIFDLLQEKNIPTIGIGKIDDLFGGKGIQKKVISKGNRECMISTIEEIKSNDSGLIMTNLVDFDMLFGHQRDVEGFAKELNTFDKELQNVIDVLDENDVLFLTADHGNDPTHSGTDHTREYVPVIAFQKSKKGKPLGVRNSFADIGSTIADFFNVDKRLLKGESFYNTLISE